MCCYFQSETLLKKKMYEFVLAGQGQLKLTHWRILVAHQIWTFSCSLVLPAFSFSCYLVLEVEMVQGQIQGPRLLKMIRVQEIIVALGGWHPE